MLKVKKGLPFSALAFFLSLGVNAQDTTTPANNALAESSDALFIFKENFRYFV